MFGAGISGPEGRKREGGIGGGGRSKKARQEREAVKLEKIWLFYARLLR